MRGRPEIQRDRYHLYYPPSERGVRDRDYSGDLENQPLRMTQHAAKQLNKLLFRNRKGVCPAPQIQMQGSAASGYDRTEIERDQFG